jgi:hypothetical protein
VLTITLPDGTTSTPAVPDPVDAGQYVVDVPAATAGRHSVRWTFTDPGCAFTDMFEVSPAEPPLILRMADAKNHLRITTPDDDDDLRDWLVTITEGIEYLCGPVCRRSVSEVQDLPFNGQRTFVLRKVPALEITGTEPMIQGGVSWTPDLLDLDGATGVVRRKDGGLLWAPLRVLYIVGRMQTPQSLTSASKIILQHLWRARYGSSRALPGIGGGEDFDVTQPVPGFGYAIPNRALQLMEPYRLPPGTA